MDLLNDKVSKLYFKFLAAAFGSALISSIYGLVDTITSGNTTVLTVLLPQWRLSRLSGT